MRRRRVGISEQTLWRAGWLNGQGSTMMCLKLGTPVQQQVKQVTGLKGNKGKMNDLQHLGDHFFEVVPSNMFKQVWK